MKLVYFNHVLNHANKAGDTLPSGAPCGASNGTTYGMEPTQRSVH